MKLKQHSPRLAALCIRVGLAIIFMYAAIDSFANPNDWIGYLPSILTDRFNGEVVLKFFSVYELALAGWLLSGVYIRFAAMLSGATLAGIVASNFGLLPITFRDIALIFAAAALYFLDES